MIYMYINAGNSYALVKISVHASVTGEVLSSGLGVRTGHSVELYVCPFRHTKALKRPNYT